MENVSALVGSIVTSIRDHPLEASLTFAVIVAALLAVALVAPGLRTLTQTVSASLADLLGFVGLHLRRAATWIAELPTAAAMGDLFALALGLVWAIVAAIEPALGALRSAIAGGWHAHRARGWAGWRVVGALVYATAFLLFAWADAGLLLATIEQLTHTTIVWAPSWLRELALQMVVTSVLSAAMLASVLTDIAGITELSIWGTLERRWRVALGTTCGVLLVLLIAAGGMLAAWRADEILGNDWLDPETRLRFAGLSQVLPIIVMLGTTGVVGWGIGAAVWLLVVLALGVAWLTMRLVRLAGGVLEVLFGTHGQSVATWIARIALGLPRLFLMTLAFFATLCSTATVAVLRIVDSLLLALAAPGTALWRTSLALIDRRPRRHRPAGHETTVPQFSIAAR